MLTKRLKKGELANRVCYFASDSLSAPERNVNSKIVQERQGW